MHLTANMVHYTVGKGRVGCGHMEATANWCSACVSMHQTANCLLLQLAGWVQCMCTASGHDIHLHHCSMQLVAQVATLEGLVGVKHLVKFYRTSNN